MGSTAKNTAPTFVDIWQTLSAVNVEDFVQDKMGLRYLSWANSWIVLMDHYPQAIMDFGANEIHEDGTVTVHCTIVIDTYARHMWLPVMDNRNKAVVRPDARQISDNKMRCMVKCLALFGLGLYIYAGEDLPSAEKDTPKSTPKPVEGYPTFSVQDHTEKSVSTADAAAIPVGSAQFGSVVNDPIYPFEVSPGPHSA